MRERGLDQQDGAGDIGAHDRFPVLGGDVAHRSGARDARVEHQAVEPPVGVHGRVDEAPEGLGVAGVGGVGEGAGLLRETVQGLGPPPGDHRLVPGGVQQPYRGGADACSPAGDDDNSLISHGRSLSECDRVQAVRAYARPGRGTRAPVVARCADERGATRRCRAPGAHVKIRRMATLSELLPVEAVRLDVPAAGWREAVRAAGDLMAATGACTADYTAEMIRNVAENGPYIVLAPGFAFAHARPSPAVLKTGMSWVRLRGPVEFGHETNDPVTLVAGLAARDTRAHTAAMAELARLLADPGTERALREARTPQAAHAVLTGRAEPGPAVAETAPGAATAPAVHKILTVCGNGLGTSLFLKNTLEQVLDRWGWSRYVTVEATDTVSAKGKAAEAVAVLTSREIARTLGDVGVPVKVVEDFTSAAEADAVLRDTYDV